jgi:ATP-dependent Lon protease
MEIIRIAGYTEDEKLEIAKRHLIPKQIKNHALKDRVVGQEDALRDLIRYYTREAGVRSLEREIANLGPQGRAQAGMSGRNEVCHVTSENLGDFAGVRKFRFGETEEKTRSAPSPALPGPRSAATSSPSRLSRCPVVAR